MSNHIKKMIKGKNIIGLGARRVVYDLGNGYVLKVAKSRYGIKSNKKEVFINRSSPSKIKKHLASIIKYGDGCGWLVMKKYTLNIPDSKEYRRKLFELRTKFRKNGIVPYEVVTRHGKPNYQNIRLKDNGKIVIIDYGNFKKRNKLQH
jgi:hypothetical protein